MYHRLVNHFRRTQYPLGDVGLVKSVLVRLDTVLVLVQDRCMVCVKCTIGTVIVLDAPGGTPR
jgi:hypothetical protein